MIEGIVYTESNTSLDAITVPISKRTRNVIFLPTQRPFRNAKAWKFKPAL